jgi:hypothetical protein
LIVRRASGRCPVLRFLRPSPRPEPARYSSTSPQIGLTNKRPSVVGLMSRFNYRDNSEL